MLVTHQEEGLGLGTEVTLNPFSLENLSLHRLRAACAETKLYAQHPLLQVDAWESVIIGLGVGSSKPPITLGHPSISACPHLPHLSDAVSTRSWVQENYFHDFLLISVLYSSKALKTVNQQESANLRLGHGGTAYRSGWIGDSCCPLCEEHWCRCRGGWWQEEGQDGLLRSLPIWEVYEYRRQLRVILYALFIMKVTQIQRSSSLKAGWPLNQAVRHLALWTHMLRKVL